MIVQQRTESKSSKREEKIPPLTCARTGKDRTAQGSKHASDVEWPGRWPLLGAGHDSERDWPAGGRYVLARHVRGDVVPHLPVGPVLLHLRAHVRRRDRVRDAAEAQVRALLLHLHIRDGRPVAGDRWRRQQYRHCLCTPCVQLPDVPDRRDDLGRRADDRVRLLRVYAHPRDAVVT